MSKSDAILIIHCLLLDHESIYELSELLHDFRKEAGYKLPSFGYKTALEFLKSIPDTVEVIETEEKIYVKLVQIGESTLLRSAIFPGWVVPDPMTQVNLDDLLSLSEDSDGPESATKGEPSGVASKTVKLKKKNKSSSVGVETHDDTSENSSPEESEDDTFSKRNITGNEVCIDDCISSIILYESDIPTINLTDHGEVGDCVEVFVPEVCNPHKFILQLKKFKVELAKLMERMLRFYSFNFNSYAVKNLKFKKNHIFAALYKTQPNVEEWYRAKIINYDAECSTVLLLDYGITAEVNNNNLKYLDRNFGDLPVQAINGHMPYIRPYEGCCWSEECNRVLFELIFEKDLVAGIIAVNNEEQQLSVTLSYIIENENEDKEVHISRSLIRKKFAVYDFDINEEEPLSLVICESVRSEGFLQPESMGRMRTIRSYFGYCGISEEQKHPELGENEPSKMSETK